VPSGDSDGPPRYESAAVRIGHDIVPEEPSNARTAFHGEMKVRDVMSRNPFTLPPNASVAAAAIALAETGVSGCPVVDASGRVVGMLTEANILEALKTQHKELKVLMPPEISFGISFVEVVRTKEAASAFSDVGQWPVERVMTKDFVSVGPDDEIEVAIQLMVKHRIHRLPVIEHGKVVGIVTRTDILKGFFRTVET
jgi:CBS domain-containing protein